MQFIHLEYTYIKKSKISTLKKKKQNNPIRKWTKYLRKHFTYEDIWMANRYVKISPASLVIREMKTKTTVVYHYILVRILK